MINPASLIGAVIGFFIGIGIFRSLLLGIIFAMIGSSIGARRSFSQHGGQYRNGFFGWASATDGPVFMETLFSMLGRLAAADGHVSTEEEQLFRRIVINEFHITSPESISRAMNIFHQAAVSNTPISVYAQQAVETFGNRPQLLEMMLIIMIRICAVSEGIHSQEDKLLREAAGIFGYSEQAFESIRSRYTFGGNSSSNTSRQSFSSNHAYEVLGVSKDASENDIRKAYRKKVSEYHPDKIAAKGLPREFTEFANKKFQEIQTAWEDIRQSRGF